MGKDINIKIHNKALKQLDELRLKHTKEYYKLDKDLLKDLQDIILKYDEKYKDYNNVMDLMGLIIKLAKFKNVANVKYNKETSDLIINYTELNTKIITNKKLIKKTKEDTEDKTKEDTEDKTKEDTKDKTKELK